MLFLFKSKREEPVARNYDASGVGFTPLPLKLEDDQKIKSNVGTLKDISALFLSIFLSAIGFGILMVMIALRLEQYVKDEVLMSVSSATQIIAGVFFARFLPIMGRKIGMINTIYFGSVLSAICSILFYFYENFFLWELVVFIYGIAAFICGVTRQTVMIDLASKQMRALVISLGGMVVAIGNSFGPIILELIKTADKFETFALACFFFLISIIPLSRLKKIEGKIREEKKIGIWRYIQHSPKIMFAGFCVNYAISASNAFLIIYGIKIGMPKNEASLLLSVLLFGSIFSIPVAYLVDIINRRLLMIFSSLLAIICAHILYLNHDPQKIYTLLFLMFGCLIAMKLSAIVLINEKYKSTQRLAVNSAFSRISLIGNFVGIFSTGALMKSIGADGLWISIIFILLLFLLFCLMNYGRKLQRKELNFKNFSIFNKQGDEQIFEI